MKIKSVMSAVLSSVATAVETAVPYVALGAAATIVVSDQTLKCVDGMCGNINKAFVGFLTRYPSIAMTLNPGSVIKMSVANNVDDMMNRRVSRRPAVTISAVMDK